MNKIPVGRTIAFGYAFFVTQFVTILRICWIPTLLVVAIEYLGRRYVYFYASGGETAGAALIDFLVMSSGLFISLLASSVMAVGVTRAAMGLPLNLGNFYFPLGRAEWHMFTANIRCFLAVLGLLFLAAVLSALALSVAGVEFGQPVEGQAAGIGVLFASLLSLFVLGFVLVVAVRLAFFLPAVVVSEDKGLERAYRLAAGNAWRMIAVLATIAGPILIAGAFFQAVIVYAAFGADGLAGGLQSVMENIDVAATVQPLLWAVYGFVTNIALMGIFPSASAFAYLKVTEEADETPEDPTRPPRVPPHV